MLKNLLGCYHTKTIFQTHYLYGGQSCRPPTVGEDIGYKPLDHQQISLAHVR
jgi:hypothetical protein